MDNILKTKGITVPQNGIHLEIQDNDKSYQVNLSLMNGYIIRGGWKNLREARGLKTGDDIKLYWKDNKIIFTKDSNDQSGSSGADQKK